MQVKQIDKPIIGKKTGVGQAFDLLLKDMLPINAWARKQKELNSKIKI
jgi:hypothetical protein